MSEPTSHAPLGGLDEEVALRRILEGTARETGEGFFAALVENLAKALNTHGAWVTEYIQECRRLRALAFWSVPLLSEVQQKRLLSYSWPGNIRELQNVMERAVITSRNGRLNLERALPDDEAGALRNARIRETMTKEVSEQILQLRELQQLERSNIMRALTAADWRVARNDGAAALLGMNPSTLNSRIRALKIERPR